MILKSLLGDNATLISPGTPTKWKESRKIQGPAIQFPSKMRSIFSKAIFKASEKKQEKWAFSSKNLVSFFAVYFLEIPNKKTETDKWQSVFYMQDKKQYLRVNNVFQTYQHIIVHQALIKVSAFRDVWRFIFLSP